MKNPGDDRNLFFGILGLQVGFFSQSQLIESMQEWILEKGTPLQDICVRKRFMTQEYADFLNELVDRHLELHSGEVEKSIASLLSLIHI